VRVDLLLRTDVQEDEQQPQLVRRACARAIVEHRSNLQQTAQ
jgi:hypothetical protein